MANRDLKKHEIILKGSAYLVENGLFDFSLRPFAEFLGTSDRMILHYFRTKDELLYELLTFLMEETIKNLMPASRAKVSLDVFIDNLPVLLLDGKSSRFFKLWIELCSYAESRLSLSEDFINKIFAMFETYLTSTIEFNDIREKERIIPLLIVVIEGSIIVASYRKKQLVKSALELLKNLVHAPASPGGR